MKIDNSQEIDVMLNYEVQAIDGKVVVISANTSHYVWQTRQNLIHDIQDIDCNVILVAPRDDYSKRFSGLNVEYVELPMKMNKNPFSDYLLYRRYLSIFREIKPDIYLGYTIKPNIYGSLAAHRLGIPTINNIAGLGTIFSSRSTFATIAKVLYHIALDGSSMIFFQNPDDRRLFTSGGVVRHDRHDLLPGSGVDLNRFAFDPLPHRKRDEPLRFLLIARMLWDKGVGEFVEAARNIRQHHSDIRFCILGGLDNDNPNAIPRSQMDVWVSEGHVEYLGYSDDVVQEILQSDCIVLPSAYPEGTPRTLLEASAVGRPIITTDAPGCRETVDDGLNGYLCKVRDSADLQRKMEQIISLPPNDRRDMGRAGRARMEKDFDEKFVIRKYINAIKDLL